MAWNRGRMDRARVVEEVRAVEAAYDAAWTRGDVEGVLDCLADDVLIVNPRGEVLRGRDGASAMLTTFLGGEARGSAHHGEVQRVEVLTDDVALVDGVATLSVTGRDPWVHAFTDVLRRRDGRWRIVQVRAYANYGPQVPGEWR